MRNTQEEKEALIKSLMNTQDLNETVHCLEKVLMKRTPFALYVATADRTNCIWIFDPETIYEMVGGKDKYDETREGMFLTPEEKETGVVFFVLKKVGPLYAVRLDIDIIDEVIEELYKGL